MAIEIVKRGTPPGEREYNVECRNCGSELKWQQRDAKRNHPGDQRDGPFSQIDCPVCGHLVTGYPR